MATSPPPISPFTGLAPQRKDKTTFSDRFDAFVTWIIAFVAQMAALSLNIYNNALEAFQSAATATSAAAAAMATANVTLWASGVAIPQYASVISPANGRTYRRKTATGSGTADPSTDPTNYEPLSTLPQGLVPIAAVTVTTAVAVIDFLNLFSSLYDKYVIEIENMTVTVANQTVSLALATSGAVPSNQTYTLVRPGSRNNQSGITLLAGSVASSIDNYGLVGTIEIRNTNTGSRCQSISVKTIAPSSDGLSAVLDEYGYNAPGPTSGFRLQISGGNFAPATNVRVYGVKNTA